MTNSMTNGVAYAYTPQADTGKQYAVIFRPVANDVALCKEFSSPYKMNEFKNKIKRSRKVIYISDEKRY